MWVTEIYYDGERPRPGHRFHSASVAAQVSFALARRSAPGRRGHGDWIRWAATGILRHLAPSVTITMRNGHMAADVIASTLGAGPLPRNMRVGDGPAWVADRAEAVARALAPIAMVARPAGIRSASNQPLVPVFWLWPSPHDVLDAESWPEAWH